MPVTFEDVAKEARSLTPQERGRLLAILIDDLDSAPESAAAEVEAAWEEEIARRLEEVDSGKVATVPAEQVFARFSD
jgi:putative addiction module component (TIGR02574 family)